VSPVTRWLDERVDLAGLRRALLDRPVPGGLTWWHTLGSATLAVFMVQVVTGVVLATYYSPSPDHAYDSIRFIDRHVASGALLRGIHHWGASAMVVLVLAHLVRVFTWGAYKYPREINWTLGVCLLFIVLGFGFTGYLLPWDQKAYWATEVGTNIAGVTPLIGNALARLLRGGSQLGAATLTRFFALHVLLFPLLLGGLVLLHVAMVIRQGIAARPWALESMKDPVTGRMQDAPAHTGAGKYREFYEAAYAAEKTGGVRFWPDIIVKDVAVSLVVIGVIMLLALTFGAGLEAPADPTDRAYVPRPEWYFLPFFQLLKLVPGSWESAIATGVPALLVIVLLALPFVDRRSTRSLGKRPVARLALVGFLAVSSMLFGAAWQDAPAHAPEVGRILSSQERAGRALFLRQQCNTCHAVAGLGGGRVEEDAPDLTKIGLRHSPAWLHSFIEDPGRFHVKSKMPAYGPPTLTHQEIEEIAQYLSSLRGVPAPAVVAPQPEYHDTFPALGTDKEKP
jgi:ubiquinol-cytochrome c reductase cytochrome b subunit